jgi:hypothetical protein
LKILEQIKQYNGYHTSADHMMCNQMHRWNIYFLDSQPVGCIQEDDPRYQKADFNNFSRIDSFDSDLWTNDERFSSEEIGAVMDVGAPLNVAKALADTKSASAAATAAATAAAVGSSAVGRQADTAYSFYTVLPDPTKTLKFTDFLEVDWLSYIFAMDLRSTPITNIASIPLTSKFESTPICIVQQEYIHKWQIIFNYWKSCEQKFIAIHLSDEFNNDPIDWYTLPNCQGVIRNYKRLDLPTNKKIIIIVSRKFRVDQIICIRK